MQHLESFRGDFDYLEMLLSDISTTEPPNVPSQQPQDHAVAIQDDEDHHHFRHSSPHHQHQQHYATEPTPPRPRTTTLTAAAFDLESTLKDLEDTFYNGKDSGLKSSPAVAVSAPSEEVGNAATPPAAAQSKREDVWTFNYFFFCIFAN